MDSLLLVFSNSETKKTELKQREVYFQFVRTPPTESFSVNEGACDDDGSDDGLNRLVLPGSILQALFSAEREHLYLITETDT